MPRSPADFVVKVKARSPWRRTVTITAACGAVILAGWVLYDYGRHRGGYESVTDAQDLIQMRDHVQRLEVENKHLSDRLALMKQGNKVDQFAYKDVSHSLKGLQDEVYELKEEVAFYRTILEPGDTKKGLRVQSLKVERDGQRDRYRYKLVLTQVLTDAAPVQGNVQLIVYGQQGTTLKALSLSDLTADKDSEIQFRFKYFQKLQGIMIFPAGFSPTRVALRVIPKGRAKETVEKTFNWSEIKA
jgi:hypothetical protein